MIPHPTRLRFLFVIFMLVSLGTTMAQKKEYVCQPCGRPCDELISAEPGTCPSCRMEMVEKSTVHIKNLSPAEFCERMAANPDALVLDVRSPGEFDGTTTSVESFGHFQRAININVTQLAERIKELERFKDKEVLVYCSHSHRSPSASYLLSTHGFSNVFNMSGGVSTLGEATKQPCLKSQFVVHTK